MNTGCLPIASGAGLNDMAESWTYDQAFSRNLGLFTPDQQQRLRESTVAIPGMGGVGGIHLMTLVRMGVGGFRIADPDHFDVGNFNRQYGAEVDHLGELKAEVMKQKALQVNPELDIRVATELITRENVDELLDGVDIVVDGIDFFSMDARRLLFRRARELGIWSMTAGPLGFSAAWLVFDPQGMSFDEYFDMYDGMDSLDQETAFAVGLTPRATHWRYMDLSYVDRTNGRGPSVGLACNLASGVVATEVAKLLTHPNLIRPVPCYTQFDAWRGVLRKGRLRRGNRHPLQRLKRRILRRRLLQSTAGG